MKHLSSTVVVVRVVVNVVTAAVVVVVVVVVVDNAHGVSSDHGIGLVAHGIQTPGCGCPILIRIPHGKSTVSGSVSVDVDDVIRYLCQPRDVILLTQ